MATAETGAKGESGPDASPAPGPAGRVALLGWILFALLVLYTYMIHQGIGPDPGRNDAWYTPSSFLFSAPVISEMFETLPEAFALFGIPAILLAVGVFLTTRSALVKATAVSCVLSVFCYVYYGVQADRIWTFFHWRASAVLTLMCFAVGFAAMAPILARSWLRLGWAARIAAYLPFLALVLGFVRNATGTDQKLQFAISPWPAVSVFGIELGALFIMVLLVGLAIGVAGIAAARARSGAAALQATLIGVVLGLGVPALLMWTGDVLRIFPFRLSGRELVAMAVMTSIAILIGGTLRVRGRPDALRLRARHLTVGAALLALPLLSGQALARYDYYVTREVRARVIIDALASYLEREDVYPDELENLVQDGDLDAIPEPSIGFSFLYDDPFRYRSFGTSFILEFPAPRWVECAYTPPYEDEDAGEDENWGVGGYSGAMGADEDDDFAADKDEDTDMGGDDEPVAAHDAHDDFGAADDDSLDEAWSCPSTPPELW